MVTFVWKCFKMAGKAVSKESNDNQHLRRPRVNSLRRRSSHRLKATLPTQVESETKLFIFWYYVDIFL